MQSSTTRGALHGWLKRVVVNSYRDKDGCDRDKDLRFQLSDFRFQVSDSRFQISGFKFQVSDSRFQVSDFRFQISGFRSQNSESHFGDLGPGEPLGGYRGNPAGRPVAPAFK